MVPDEQPHGFQHVAWFLLRGDFGHLHARICDAGLEEPSVYRLKQPVRYLHLIIYGFTAYV